MAIRVHEIKIQQYYADSVYFGDKIFEVRYNDRGYQKGDIVRFDVNHCPRHPLNDKQYEITYVLGSFIGLADGYVAFGIKEVPKCEQCESEE